MESPSPSPSPRAPEPEPPSPSPSLCAPAPHSCAHLDYQTSRQGLFMKGVEGKAISKLHLVGVIGAYTQAGQCGVYCR